MRHIAIAVPDGYVCAYRRPNGQLCAVSDHTTREAAQAHADEINRQLAAELAAQRSSRALHRQHGMRRPVRWFEPDAFA